MDWDNIFKFYNKSCQEQMVLDIIYGFSVDFIKWKKKLVLVEFLERKQKIGKGKEINLTMHRQYQLGLVWGADVIKFCLSFLDIFHI